MLGRITSFSSEGRLSTETGEDFSLRTVRESREIPEDLREDYLRYKVTIRVLGVLRSDAPRAAGSLTFVASHRRLPHVGSRVAFPSGEVLREIAGHNMDGAIIGHFALGEYLYCQPPSATQSAAEAGVDRQPWMRYRSPEIAVRFPVSSLVSRRSFVFARAGFGKSNLNKLLFSTLYERTPTVE